MVVGKDGKGAAEGAGVLYCSSAAKASSPPRPHRINGQVTGQPPISQIAPMGFVPVNVPVRCAKSRVERWASHGCRRPSGTPGVS